MNTKKLDQIIANYIERFDELKKENTGEIYKWRIVAAFKPMMDEALEQTDAETFHKQLVKICKLTENLIDNGTELPFSALCAYAAVKEETWKVRDMLKALFADDGGDLSARQEKIDVFLEDCAELKEKTYPGSWKYQTTQRAAMSYLFLYDPDHNYLYKSTQASAFADHVGFLDEWGSGADYQMDVYYRMCDELVAHIKNHQELLRVNGNWYDNGGAGLYPDKEYHLLASDIIYCCSVYGLMNNIELEHATAEEKRQARAHRDMAQKLLEAKEAAQQRADRLAEARTYVQRTLVPGMKAQHVKLGTVRIEKIEDFKTPTNCFTIISVCVEEQNKTIRLQLQALVDGTLRFEDAAIANQLSAYADIIKMESAVTQELNKANAAYVKAAQ